MTRDEWAALAIAIRKVRGTAGMDAATLDAVTDEIAATLKQRSTRFDAARFREMTRIA